VNFVFTFAVHPALVVRVARGGRTTVQAEDDFVAEEKRRPRPPVPHEQEEDTFFFPSTRLFQAQMALKPFGGPSFVVRPNSILRVAALKCRYASRTRKRPFSENRSMSGNDTAVRIINKALVCWIV
jgi:hypothetical protein